MISLRVTIVCNEDDSLGKKSGAVGKSSSRSAYVPLGMTVYRLRSFGHSHRIIAVQRFSAADDAEAVSMACTMIRGAEAVASFDLWEGEHLIHYTAPVKEKPRW